MKINIWQVAFQIVAELLALKALQPGSTDTLPPIHIKSGTTAVDIVITVTEDAPKAPVAPVAAQEQSQEPSA